MKCSAVLAYAAAAVAVVNAQSDIKPLILDGTEVPVGTRTYISGLRETASGSDRCGGSLVTPTHIITAAHCAGDWLKYVSVGTHYLSGTTDGQQVAVKKQIKHPQFDMNSMVHDTLILELATPVKGIKPVKIIDSSFDVKKDDVLTVLGWGLTKESGSQSNVLLELDIKTWDNAACNAVTAYKGKIFDSMVCAGGIKGQDSCQGDSGGPLIIQRNGEDVLVGVVSWGEGCGRANTPGIYNRLATSLDFIYANIPELKPGGSPTPSSVPSVTPTPTTKSPTPTTKAPTPTTTNPTPKPTTKTPTPKPTTKTPTPKPTTKAPTPGPSNCKRYSYWTCYQVSGCEWSWDEDSCVASDF